MSDQSGLYSLVSGEGDGFMLGLAAGDTAGGAWELGYSAITEQATVISYQLIQRRRLSADLLTRALRELDGGEDGDQVFRSESGHFRAWLDQAAAGYPVPGEEPSLDAMARACPLGVSFRSDPDGLLSATAELGRLFHSDASTVTAGLITASAVAASCFAQSGLDLVSAVRDAVVPSVGELVGDLPDAERVADLDGLFARALTAVGVRDGEAALEASGGDRDDPTHAAVTALLLAAPVSERHHAPVEQAARVGGSALAAPVGAMVGARVGIKAWPWAFANDTWFAEIGRRVVRGPDDVRDLPIPYAVEQHLMSGSSPGFH